MQDYLYSHIEKEFFSSFWIEYELNRNVDEKRDKVLNLVTSEKFDIFFLNEAAAQAVYGSRALCGAVLLRPGKSNLERKIKSML